MNSCRRNNTGLIDALKGGKTASMANQEAQTQWVLSEIEGTIDKNGAIEASTLWSEPQTTPRPRSVEQIRALIDPDLDAIARLTARQPGRFKTRLRWGRGIAWLVQPTKLSWLTEPDRKVLTEKYGEWDERMAFSGPWRGKGAPQTRLCVDTCNDVATHIDPRFVVVRAGLEMAASRRDGWARYVVPDLPVHEQRQLDALQAEWWRLLRPNFPCVTEATVEFTDFGRDTLDGVRSNLTGEVQSGSGEDVRVCWLVLPGTGWRLRDLEHRRGNPNKRERVWVPLRRKFMLICRRTRSGQSPLMFELTPAGFVENSRVTVLSGEALEYDTNDKTKGILRDALGWLPHGV